MPTPSDGPSMHLDPHILDFFKALEAQGGPPLYTLSAASARNALLSVQRSVNVPKLPATSSDRTLRGGPTGEIALRIVRPQGASGAPLKGRYFVKRAGKRIRLVGAGVAGMTGGDPWVARRPVPLPLRTCPPWATQASPLHSAPLPPLRM